MKLFSIMPVLTAIIFTAASCKKNDVMLPPVAQAATPKLARVEQVGGSWAVNYSYNSAGRLVQSADNNFTVNYSYTGTPFGYEIYNSANAKVYNITGVQLAGGKINQFMYSGINASGAVN